MFMSAEGLELIDSTFLMAAPLSWLHLDLSLPMGEGSNRAEQVRLVLSLDDLIVAANGLGEYLTVPGPKVADHLEMPKHSRAGNFGYRVREQCQ